ncbi:hypothetical protein Tco_1559764, partial [Tanacetum coccineum]
ERALYGLHQPLGFDVDSLSKCMNYVTVVAGNQTNGIARTRNNIVTGPKDSKEHARVKPTEVDKSEASNKYGKDEQDLRSEFERLIKLEKQTKHPNSTNSINTVSTPVSTDEPSSTYDAPSSPVNAAKTSEEHLFEQFSTFKNAFTHLDVPNVSPMDDNTEIFAGAYDDEDVGGQEPKKVIQALKDPTWIEAMQEELLLFELQKVYTLVDLPNGKRAIGIKWYSETRKMREEFLLETRKDWLHKMDVKSAFLYGTSEEEVEKALYGLHQPPGSDVDSLSKSINYVPVIIGNQTNGIVGTRDNIVASQAE